MVWSQFHSSQPHPHYPLLARTLGQQPRQEGRPCCLCDNLIHEDTRTLTHSLRKCSDTFHESCFFSYDQNQKAENGLEYRSPCPSCNGNLTIEKTHSVQPLQSVSTMRKAAHHTNMLIGAYVEFMRALWQDLKIRDQNSPPENDPVLSMEETCQALTNGLRGLMSQIQSSEDALALTGFSSFHFEENADVQQLQRRLKSEEERFRDSALASERARVLDIDTPQDSRKQVDALVRVFTEWFTQYDYQVELRRDQGDPMQDDYSEDEYHTVIEWAGEIHGFYAAVNFGFKLDEDVTLGEEQLLENRIRERLARHLVTAHVLRSKPSGHAKEDALALDRRLCAFWAKMEGEYENSLHYASD